MVFTAISEAQYEQVFIYLEQELGLDNNFFLTGSLGAGKTTFVRKLGLFLGVKELITSPTFSIMQVYHAGNTPIYHLDLYRLCALEEAYEIGVEELLFETPGLKLLEWGEKFPELMRAGYQILLEKDTELTRKISIKKV